MLALGHISRVSSLSPQHSSAFLRIFLPTKNTGFGHFIHRNSDYRYFFCLPEIPHFPIFYSPHTQIHILTRTPLLRGSIALPPCKKSYRLRQQSGSTLNTNTYLDELYTNLLHWSSYIHLLRKNYNKISFQSNTHIFFCNKFKNRIIHPVAPWIPMHTHTYYIYIFSSHRVTSIYQEKSTLEYFSNLLQSLSFIKKWKNETPAFFDGFRNTEKFRQFRNKLHQHLQETSGNTKNISA